MVPTPEKLLTYECGVDPVGEGWAHTQVRYYVYAFLYVIFAVDSIFLFPWATVFAAAGLRRDDARGDVHLPRLPGRGPALRIEEGRPDMDVTPDPTTPCPCRVEPVLLPEPKRLGALARLAPEPMKVVLNWGRRYSLWVFNFGLACCAIEFIAASMARHDFIRLGVIPFAPGPRQADLMVVSGTVTDKMAPAVKRLYEQMPEPKYVISFGACSNCGGPYWDSYSVTKGVDQIIPVDVYVPGCPPRPEALLQGILKLQEKIARESLGERYGSGTRPRPVRRRPCSQRPGRRRRARRGSGRVTGRRGRPVTGRLPAAAAEELFGEEATAEEAYDAAHRRRPRRRPGSPRWRPPATSWAARYFDWLSAVDEPGTGFRVCAHVVALGPGRVRRLLRAYDRPARGPRTAHRRRVYAGAAWHERETHEMFGVDFTGHPHLVPLLLPEAFEGHPLRKDFVLAARVAKAWPGAKEPGESGARRPQAPPDAAARRPRPERVGPPQGPAPAGPGPPGPRRGAARGGRPPGPARAHSERRARRARPRRPSAAAATAARAGGRRSPAGAPGDAA